MSPEVGDIRRNAFLEVQSFSLNKTPEFWLELIWLQSSISEVKDEKQK